MTCPSAKLSTVSCISLRHDEVVSVDEVSEPQLISFSVASDVLNLVIAHCNYSLEVGKGTLVEYDLECLQRQIYEKFIRGRPMLVTKVRDKFKFTAK